MKLPSTPAFVRSRNAQRIALGLVAVLALLVLGYYLAVAQGHRDPLPEEVAPPPPQAMAAYRRVLGTNTLICGVPVRPPYFDFTNDGQDGADEGTGLAKDLAGIVVRALRLNVQLVESEGGRQYTDLKDSRIDAHCFDTPLIYSNMRHLDYSRPLFFVPLDVYGRANTSRNLNSAAISFIATEGDFSQVLTVENYPKATRVVRTPDEPLFELMAEVAHGRVNAIIADSLAVETFNKKNPRTPLVKLTSRPLVHMPISISTYKGDQNLLNMINEAIGVLLNKGELQRIIRAYDPAGKHLLLPTPDFIPLSAG